MRRNPLNFPFLWCDDMMCKTCVSYDKDEDCCIFCKGYNPDIKPDKWDIFDLNDDEWEHIQLRERLYEKGIDCLFCDMWTDKKFWCLDGYESETSVIIDGKFAPTNGWLCDKLNKLYEENKELKASLYAEKTNTAEVVNDYTKQFKRHSTQFIFMMDLAEDLGVDVRKLEALDD